MVRPRNYSAPRATGAATARERADAFQRAVTEDTAFALAYYRLALAYSWSSDSKARPTAQRAIPFSDRLSPPDRALVVAFLPSGSTRAFIAPANQRQGEGELPETSGRKNDAARHFARSVELWKDADPPLRRAVTESQARLDRLRKSVRDSS